MRGLQFAPNKTTDLTLRPGVRGPQIGDSTSNPALLTQGDITVELHTRPYDDSKVHDFWRSFAQTRDADPDFLSFLVSSRPEAEELNILVVRRDHRIEALLVGRQEWMRHEAKVGYLRFFTPSLRTLIVSYGGWLGPIDDLSATALVDGLLEMLRLRRTDATLFHFLPSNSPLARQALTRPPRLVRDRSVSRETHRFLRCSSGAESLLQSISTNERSNQRRRGRKLAKDFHRVDIETFRRPEDIAPLMTRAEHVAQRSYQRGLGVGFSSSNDIRSRLQYFADAGWLRGFALLLNGSPCAFWIGSLRRGVFVSDYLAFDPAYSKYAPGMYLTLESLALLEKDQSAPIHCVDFGLGDAVYKERLGNASEEESQVLIYGTSPRALAANFMRSTLGRVNPWLRSLANANAWAAQAKKIMRSRYAARDGA